MISLRYKHLTFPLFLIIISLTVLIHIPKVYAGSPLVYITTGTQTASCSPCSTPSIQVQSGDLLIVQDNLDGCESNGVPNISSSPSETWSQQIVIGDYIIFTATAHSTTQYVASCAISEPNSFGPFSISNYRGTFSGFGSSTTNSPGASQSGTDTINLNVQAGSIIYESFMLFNNNQSPSNCPVVSQNNGQVQRVNQCISGLNAITGGYYETGPTVGSGTASIGITWSGCTGGSSTSCQIIRHSALELKSVVPVGSVGTTNACYGVCGNPPVTLNNLNATHSINFNNSQTIFYEAQSNLNGFVQNVSTSLAKSYSNGMIVTLALYLTAGSCPANQAPFTSQCAGLIQSSQGFLNPSKGKLTMALQTPVTIGQWLGIAVSGNLNGLDLNETNGSCGSTGGVNCANPPGMVFTNGISPSVITTTGSLNVASISTTGLWSWIFGAITSQVPPPPIATPCINTDLSCFMIASACALTPSNCFIGGAFILIIYFVVYLVATALASAYVSREYGYQVHLPGALHFGVFLLMLFMFTAMGLVPSYVTAVIFIFVALGVAGYFGSGFSGRGHAE